MAVAAVADDFFCDATAGAAAGLRVDFAPVDAAPDEADAFVLPVVFLSALSVVAFVAFAVFSVFAEPLVDFSLAIVSVPCLDVEDDNGADAGVRFGADVVFAAVPVVFFAAAPAAFCVVPVLEAGAVPVAFVPAFVAVPAVRVLVPAFAVAAAPLGEAALPVDFFAAVSVAPAVDFFFAGAAAFAAGCAEAAFFPVVLPVTDADVFAVFAVAAGFCGLAGAAPVAFFRLPAATVAFFAVDAFAMKILLKKLWRTMNLHNIGESLLKFYSRIHAPTAA